MGKTKENITPQPEEQQDLRERAVVVAVIRDGQPIEQAEEFLKVWHLNEETYMNPHLEYGQSIPGICTGRGIGLIDTSGSYRIFDAIGILE